MSSEWPEAWGTVRVVDVGEFLDARAAAGDAAPRSRGELDGDDDEDGWAGWWSQWAFPGEGGRYGHNTPCSVCPDTGVLLVHGELVALLDVVHLVIENHYVYDAEYYQALRVREIVDARRWSELPAAPYGVGDVVFAWDKYNSIDYTRTPDADPRLSFGGEWSDVQALVDEKLGPVPGAAPRSAGASLFALIRAIEAGDAARVGEILDAGVDPTGGAEAPTDRNIQLVFTTHKSSTPLWETINCANPEVLRAMLERGADPSHQPPGAQALVHGAVRANRPEHLRLLLAAGADARATWRGETCRDMAVKAGLDELVRILDDHAG